MAVCNGKIEGRACVVKNFAEVGKIQGGDILIAYWYGFSVLKFIVPFASFNCAQFRIYYNLITVLILHGLRISI
jgi:hypothetical protein